MLIVVECLTSEGIVFVLVNVEVMFLESCLLCLFPVLTSWYVWTTVELWKLQRCPDYRVSSYQGHYYVKNF